MSMTHTKQQHNKHIIKKTHTQGSNKAVLSFFSYMLQFANKLHTEMVL